MLPLCRELELTPEIVSWTLPAIAKPAALVAQLALLLHRFPLYIFGLGSYIAPSALFLLSVILYLFQLFYRFDSFYCLAFGVPMPCYDLHFLELTNNIYTHDILFINFQIFSGV
ncbi:hypothetical protein SETIT_2G190800v2 [Setaria italica]|uniref:Uncharacterized protein n=1 Tax=Setaria italica TaxID=4555 RepID=A0A368Q2P8_SETIT|nr:hypothetical protein SETIT_2G190800v2 [Setaria italica]